MSNIHSSQLSASASPAACDRISNNKPIYSCPSSAAALTRFGIFPEPTPSAPGNRPEPPPCLSRLRTPLIENFSPPCGALTFRNLQRTGRERHVISIRHPLSGAVYDRVPTLRRFLSLSSLSLIRKVSRFTRLDFTFERSQTKLKGINSETPARQQINPTDASVLFWPLM